MEQPLIWMSQGPDTSGPAWALTYRTPRARHLLQMPPSLGWGLFFPLLPLILLAPPWSQERLDTDRKTELSCCLMGASFKSPDVAPEAGPLDSRLGSRSIRWRILLRKRVRIPPPVVMMVMRLLAHSTPLSRGPLPIEEINLQLLTPVPQIFQVTHLVGSGG